MKNFVDKKMITNLFVTFLYAIITLFVVLRHEIWADEAQVWQIVRHVGFFDLFKHLVNEGHPSFFYLLMMPVAKVFQNSESIIYMQIVCWLSSCVAVFLLLWKSPFNPVTKLAITTSAGFLYFFPVIARSYSIIPMLVFALAILYSKQKEHPYWYVFLIVILANTHILMFGFCAVLVCLFIYENIVPRFKEDLLVKTKNLILASIIAVLGLGAVVLQLCGTMGNNAAIGFAFPDIFRIFSIFTTFFMSNIDGRASDMVYIMTHNISLSVFVMFLFCVILYLCIFVCLYLKNKKMFLVALGGIGFQFFVYIFSYGIVYTSRVFCAHLILIFAFWVALNQENSKEVLSKLINIFISIFMFCTLSNGFKYLVQDYFYNYSSAKETAEFIKNNLTENSLFYTDNAPYSIALVYYLDGIKPIYSVVQRHYLKYVIWDDSFWHYVPEDEWGEYAKMLMKAEDYQGENLYLLFSGVHKNQLEMGTPKNYKLIFQSKPAMAFCETYQIFQYVGDRAQLQNKIK